MNPARAMGTFLRTWRAEWAHLSRAQLAIGVSTAGRLKKPLKPGVIRWWEDGQPPASTAEFDGLLKVMQRHGLGPPEIEQFRQAVFAACVDRQYPGLFQEDDLTHRRDCDELAEAMYRRALPKPYCQIVPLVCCVRQLEDAVTTGRGAPNGRGQARSRGVALVYLREVLAALHEMAGRFQTAAAVAASNAAFVEGFLGPRVLGGPVSVIGQRRREAYCRLCASLPHGGPWVRRLVSIHGEAWERGEEEVAIGAFAGALDGAHLLCDPHERSAYIAEGQRLVPAGALRVSEGMVVKLHSNLALALLKSGRVDEGERHFRYRPQPPDTDPYDLCSWHQHAGLYPLARGHRDEAQRHLETSLALARQNGYQALAHWARLFLEECDRIRKPLRAVRPAPTGGARKKR